MSSMPQLQRSFFINRRIDRVNNEREVNVDFNIPVSVETKLIDWQMSSINGNNKKYFERFERTKYYITVLIQFPAGRTFRKFGHEGGMELLVLSGVFSDSDGDYGAGSYVRNPAGTYHQPFTSNGCTVLLKLGRFQPMDRKRVVIDTMNSAHRWLPVADPGVSRLALHHFSEEDIYLYRIRSECWITFKHENHGLELFICNGSISVKGDLYVPGDWLRYPVGSKVKVSAVGDVCLYVKKCFFPQ
jgi:hypothetical protein